jgi:hypothetical protein
MGSFYIATGLTGENKYINTVLGDNYDTPILILNFSDHEVLGIAYVATSATLYIVSTSDNQTTIGKIENFPSEGPYEVINLISLPVLTIVLTGLVYDLFNGSLYTLYVDFVTHNTVNLVRYDIATNELSYPTNTFSNQLTTIAQDNSGRFYSSQYQITEEDTSFFAYIDTYFENDNTTVTYRIDLSNIYPYVGSSSTISGLSFDSSGGLYAYISSNTQPLTEFQLVEITLPVNVMDNGYVSAIGDPSLVGSVVLSTMSACIHGSSQVLLENNTHKQIAQLTVSDTLLSPNGEKIKIRQIVPCGINGHNNNAQKCIVFEKDSISPNVPTQRFAVDPGHPICTIRQYKMYGISALKPAKLFLKDDKAISSSSYGIYNSTYFETGGLLQQPNMRYDLILCDNHKVFIANGIVIKSRIGFLNDKKGYNID